MNNEQRKLLAKQMIICFVVFLIFVVLLIDILAMSLSILTVGWVICFIGLYILTSEALYISLVATHVKTYWLKVKAFSFLTSLLCIVFLSFVYDGLKIIIREYLGYLGVVLVIALLLWFNKELARMVRPKVVEK